MTREFAASLQSQKLLSDTVHSYQFITNDIEVLTIYIIYSIRNHGFQSSPRQHPPQHAYGAC
jgi:hypothetical protein